MVCVCVCTTSVHIWMCRIFYSSTLWVPISGLELEADAFTWWAILAALKVKTGDLHFRYFWSFNIKKKWSLIAQ